MTFLRRARFRKFGVVAVAPVVTSAAASAPAMGTGDRTEEEAYIRGELE